MQTPEGNMKKTKAAGRTAAKTALLALICVLCALVLLHVTILRITTVTVVGNVHVSRSEIISLAGLNRPLSILNVREKDVREGIDSHVRLNFDRLEYEGINGLVIYVTERVPCVNLIAHDGVYLLDAEGLVLEKTEGDLANGLMSLTGMNAKYLAVGQKLIPVDVKQLSAYTCVMQEMLLQNCLQDFSEINVAHADGMYLVTPDGYVIDLGDMQDMRAKLFTLRGVLREVRSLGYQVGTLDATVPGTCIYTPPDV